MSNRSDLAEILRRLADYVDRHPDAELAPLFEKAARLTRSRKERPSEAMTEVEAYSFASRLQTMTSRDEGLSMLKAEIPTRRSLEVLARSLRLPVQKDDTVERLRQKIVENIIGARLRSEAIQGNS